MKGNLDMNAVTGDVDSPTFSDAEISGLRIRTRNRSFDNSC